MNDQSYYPLHVLSLATPLFLQIEFLRGDGGSYLPKSPPSHSEIGKEQEKKMVVVRERRPFFFSD